MQVNVQSRSVLYEKPGLVPEGIYEATLIEIRRFTNAFGERVGMVFELTSGEQAGTRLMESAAPSSSLQSKLGIALRGLLGREPTRQEMASSLSFLVGTPCQILVRVDSTRTGSQFSKVAAITPG